MAMVLVLVSIDDVEDAFQMLWDDLPDDVLLQVFMEYMLHTYVGCTPDPDYVSRERGAGRGRGVRRGAGRGAGKRSSRRTRGRTRSHTPYVFDTTVEPLRHGIEG